LDVYRKTDLNRTDLIETSTKSDSSQGNANGEEQGEMKPEQLHFYLAIPLSWSLSPLDR